MRQPIAARRVVINEIYYDHPGRDDGWEFVELCGAGADTVYLAGWSVESLDGDSGRIVRLWTGSEGMHVAPGAVLCIAGSARDPADGCRLAGGLENGPDAVRLVAPWGIADIVGYGALSTAGLFEGSPAPDVAAGASLARKPDGADSDCNADDFVPSDPTPGRRNFFARDLAVSHAPTAELPCAGDLFTLVVRLRNAGLEPFAGKASIRIVAGVDLSDADTIVAGKEVRLAPAAVDSIGVPIRMPAAGRIAAAAFLEDTPDDWAGNDTTRTEFRTSPGDVVINEIMYRPGENECEWIELFATADCDLRGWTMRDDAGSEKLISGEALIVPARCYCILVRDSLAFVARYPRCSAPAKRPAGGWPSLNDSERNGIADRVSLHDSRGVLVESVGYPDLLGEERGRSIERIAEDVCSAAPGGIWHRSAARDGATPGCENSTRVRGRAPRSGLRVEPNPFSPVRHGATVITGVAAAGEDGFRVRIFSIAGIEVRRLYAERGGACVFSCRWDGRDDGGDPTPTGVYVCLVEYLGTGGGVCRREKICIVVARG